MLDNDRGAAGPGPGGRRGAGVSLRHTGDRRLPLVTHRGDGSAPVRHWGRACPSLCRRGRGCPRLARDRGRVPVSRAGTRVSQRRAGGGSGRACPRVTPGAGTGLASRHTRGSSALLPPPPAEVWGGRDRLHAPPVSAAQGRAGTSDHASPHRPRPSSGHAPGPPRCRRPYMGMARTRLPDWPPPRVLGLSTNGCSRWSLKGRGGRAPPPRVPRPL